MAFSRVSVLLLFLVAAAFAPIKAGAQIASPVNAGQNSGDNSSPSSATSIGTPNFSQPLTVSLVSGVTVDENGALVADPELEEKIRRALEESVSRVPGSPLLAVATASLSEDFTAPLLASAADLPVTSMVPGSSTVELQGEVLLVSVAGERVAVATKPSNQASLRSFVDKALKAGLTPSSLSLGAQLVAIGTPVDSTLELTSSLQGLASQPRVDALARGIAAFNQIVNTSSPALRSQLNSSPVFIAASNVLRAARSVMPAQR